MRRQCLRISHLLIAAFVFAASAEGAFAQTGRDSSKVSMPNNQRDTIPIGFGSLKQDGVSLSIRTGALLVKVTPMNEAVIRLTAPDTWRRLHALKEAHKQELNKSMGDQDYFLVSFFSYEPDVTFQPQDIQLSHQGRTLRSTAIVPITTGWGKQRLAQQESQTAIYAFDGPIDYEQDITLQYGMDSATNWSDIIRALQDERAKVKSRAGH